MILPFAAKFLECIITEIPSAFCKVEVMIDDDGLFTIKLHKPDLKVPISIEGTILEDRVKSIKLILKDCHDMQVVDDLIKIIDEVACFGRLEQKPISEAKQKELERNGENLIVWG